MPHADFRADDDLTVVVHGESSSGRVWTDRVNDLLSINCPTVAQELGEEGCSRFAFTA